MAKKIVLILALLTFSAFSAFAQKDYPKTDDESDADKMFEVEEYIKAALLYQNCLKLSPKNYRVHYKLAQCFELSLNYAKAETAYLNATKFDQSPWPLAVFKYGQLLKINGKYPEAKKQFEAFLTFESEDAEKKKYDQRAVQEYNGCIIAMQELQKPIRDFNFTDLPEPVNTRYNDFAPNIYENDSSLVLTSGRPNASGLEYGKLGEAFSDNYRFRKIGKNKWEEIPLTDNFTTVNSLYNDGAGVFNKNKSKFYVTNCSEKVKEKDSNTEGECAIFVSEIKDGKWNKPVKLNKNINLPGSWNAQPALSVSNDTMYFVSKRKGGFGGHDLWYSTNLGGTPDNWGPAINMGEIINTTEVEMAPYVDSKTGTLFFASNGHMGFGGLDVFRTNGLDFDEIENLGLPFNSNRDDFYFVLGDSLGYLSTNRVGGAGGDDIYSFTRQSKPPVLVDLNLDNDAEQGRDIDVSSQIIDLDSKLPAENVAVILKDKDGNVIARTKTNADGNFRFEKLPTHTDYLIELDMNDVQITDKVKYMVQQLEVQKTQTKVIDHSAYKTLVAYINVDSLGKGFETFSLESKVQSDPKSTQPYTVKITDTQGKTLYEVKTLADGTFKFKDVPLNGNMKVMVEVPNGLVAYKIDKAKVTGTGNVTKLVPFKMSSVASDLNKDITKNVQSVTISSTAYNKKTNKPLTNTGVILQDEKGKEVARGYTDAKGNFKFSQLPLDVNYKIVFEDKVPDFTYHKLVKDTIDNLSKIAIRSTVVSKGNKPKAGVTVQLIGPGGKVLQTAVTDANGDFKFTNLPLDIDFKLGFQDKIADVSFKPIVYDTLKNIASISISSIVLDGKTKKAMPNTIVQLLDENGKVLKTTKTDENGNFIFTNLPNTTNYKLEIADFVDDFTKTFDFSNLKIITSDESSTRLAFENIYFDSNSSDLRPEALKVLDEVANYYHKNNHVQIEMNGNADSRGSAIYNLILSEKRAMKALDYLVSKGVKRNAIVETAAGASKPIETNDNEAGRALNRRVELYIVGEDDFRSKYMAYVVEPNMDAIAVAKKFDMSLEELKEVNNLSSNQLVPHTPLRIRKLGESEKFIPLHSENKTTTKGKLESVEKQVGVYLPLSFYAATEEFKIQGAANLKKENYLLRIYDKFGKLVFESKEPTKGWNGVYATSGKIANKGVYTYMLKATTSDGETIERVGNLSKLD
jgi:outer membrane protein OmpA-like peptidoglycan-associated protein/tetratricopeptide (TPR) repeat protein